MARVAVGPGEAGQRSEPWQRSDCVCEPCSPPLPTCQGATLLRCAAKRDAPQRRSLQAARDKGVRQNRPVPRVAARERVCGVAPLGKGWPLPARRALHPSLSRGNAGAKLVLTRPNGYTF